MSCVTNPLKDRPSACPGAADAYGAKKAYTGEKRIAFIGYDPTTPRGELRRTGNRLVSMETATNKVGTTVPVVRLEFVYDYQGRRVSKTVYEWESTNWVEQSESTFVYDSWNLIRESSTGVSPVTNSYVWGLDLSGSLQGAGGIGGLVATVRSGDPEPVEGYYTFDANENVSELLTDTGTIAAHYVEAERKSVHRRKSDPYGKTLVASGALADENKFRFSTKPVEENSGLVLFEHRVYKTGYGRFMSRDPVGVSHGKSLYVFVDNAPVGKIDPRGLSTLHNPLGAGDQQEGNIGLCSYHGWKSGMPEGEGIRESGIGYCDSTESPKVDLDKREPCCVCGKEGSSYTITDAKCSITVYIATGYSPDDVVENATETILEHEKRHGQHFAGYFSQKLEVHRTIGQMCIPHDCNSIRKDYLYKAVRALEHTRKAQDAFLNAFDDSGGKRGRWQEIGRIYSHKAVSARLDAMRLLAALYLCMDWECKHK